MVMGLSSASGGFKGRNMVLRFNGSCRERLGLCSDFLGFRDVTPRMQRKNKNRNRWYAAVYKDQVAK